MTAAAKSSKTLTGRVVSDRMSKTITVQILRKVKHPLYKKVVVRTTRLHVHDADEIARIGDTVLIREVRPISRTKSWTIERVLTQASDEAAGSAPDNPDKESPAEAAPTVDASEGQGAADEQNSAAEPVETEAAEPEKQS
ncbi:MAG: 30S ribosomal protein S17 [Gammaproteobacteria bacterium AqS3]|nr:30S ribosomal protein S17 [Gammaproteobacteria bacterium AqS3]